MAKLTSTVNIVFEIEPIVKLECLNIKCKFHLNPQGWMCCQLKQITINENGLCNNFEVIKKSIPKNKKKK